MWTLDVGLFCGRWTFWRATWLDLFQSLLLDGFPRRWRASCRRVPVRCSPIRRRDVSRRRANPQMNTSGSALRLSVLLRTNSSPGVWPTLAFSELSPTLPARVAAHPVAIRHEYECRGCMARSSWLPPGDHLQRRLRNLPPSLPEPGTSDCGHLPLAASSEASRRYQNPRVVEAQYDSSSGVVRDALSRRQTRIQGNGVSG